MDVSHLSSLGLLSFCLQIRPRLCCIFSLCSHRSFFSRRQSPSTTMMVSLSLTSLTPLMSFPSLTTTRQRSSSPRRAENTVLHESLVSQTFQRAVSLHDLTIIKPLHPSPTIVLSPILSESNVSSQKKSQIGEQLHGSNTVQTCRA